MKTIAIVPAYPTSDIINNFSDRIEMLVIDESNENHTQEFFLVLRELLISDHSTNTKKAIISDMKLFYTWYGAYNNEVFTFKRCIKDDILSYKAHLLNEQKASRSINRKLSHLRIFFRKAEELEYISKNPTTGVRKLPAPQLIPRAILPAEYRRIIKETVIRDDIRAKCIFELM